MSIANIMKYGSSAVVLAVVLYVLALWLPRNLRNAHPRITRRLTKAGAVVLVLTIAVMVIGDMYIRTHSEFILFRFANLVGSYNVAWVLALLFAIVVGSCLDHFGVKLLKEDMGDGDDDGPIDVMASTSAAVRPRVTVPIIALLAFLALAIANVVGPSPYGDPVLLICLVAGAILIWFFVVRKGQRDLNGKLWFIVWFLMVFWAIYQLVSLGLKEV